MSLRTRRSDEGYVDENCPCAPVVLYEDERSLRTRRSDEGYMDDKGPCAPVVVMRATWMRRVPAHPSF